MTDEELLTKFHTSLTNLNASLIELGTRDYLYTVITPGYAGMPISFLLSGHGEKTEPCPETAA